MIIFNGIRDDNKGINFYSIYENEITVRVKIIDGYSGLCSYGDRMTLYPGVNYFVTHYVKIFHRRFEVWNDDYTKLYLKIDIQDNGSINLKDLDVFNCLKDFKYNRHQDLFVALPLYEIFCDKLYVKSHCKINPNDIVVDIGANVGFFSYFALCQGAKKVYSFEPSTESIQTLRENFNFPNLIVEESAVTNINGTVTFYYNDEYSIGSSLFTPELGDGVVCKSININDYIIENKIPKINYLKIDCEGSEYEIIESLSEDYLSNNIDYICIEYHFNTDSRLLPMLEKLKRCGFKTESEGGGDVQNIELGVFYAWK